jgi:hypothetical protein
MQNLVRLSASILLSLVLTIVMELIVLLQQANMFFLESTIAMALTMRLALYAGIDTLSIGMPGTTIFRASIRHHSGSALHWLVSVTAGLVFSVLLGTSLVAQLTSPGVNYNLNNALTVFITTPLSAVVFVGFTLLFYWLLKRY